VKSPDIGVVAHVHDDMDIFFGHHLHKTTQEFGSAGPAGKDSVVGSTHLIILRGEPGLPPEITRRFSRLTESIRAPTFMRPGYTLRNAHRDTAWPETKREFQSMFRRSSRLSASAWQKILQIVSGMPHKLAKALSAHYTGYANSSASLAASCSRDYCFGSPLQHLAAGFHGEDSRFAGPRCRMV